MTLKAYKILKTYPSLPMFAKVGDYVCARDMSYGIIQYYNLDHLVFSKSFYSIPQMEVENNPEYFEKCELEITIKEV